VAKKYTDKVLQQCFHPRIGKPGLRKTKPDINRSKEHLRKAHNNLRAMRLMFREELFDWTVICGYYAMYHSVLAALLYIGLEALAHHCAIAAFREFYIERGKVKPEYIQYIEKAKQLEKKYADALEEARKDRVVVQYGVEVLTNDDADWILEDAEDFVSKIEETMQG
jgi:uncharacterized protein (UPF0332 family)